MDALKHNASYKIVMLKSRIKLLIIFFAAAALLLGGCSISGLGDLTINIEGDNKEYSSDEITLNQVNAVSADIADNVGNVSIEYSDNDTVSIDIDFTASGKHKDELSAVLEAVTVKAEIVGDVLKVSVVNKDTDENMWNWIEKEYRGHSNKPNLSADLDIKLPATIQDFDVTCNVGNIDLDALRGSFDIISNVGNIDAMDINFIGDCSIKADVGDINCSFSKDMKEASEISLIANVGSVDLDTNGLDYTIDNHDKNNFVGTSETISIEDFCTVDVNISVGKLSIDK